MGYWKKIDCVYVQVLTPRGMVNTIKKVFFGRSKLCE